MRAKRTVTIPPPIAILLELVAHAIEPEAALKLISLGLRGRGLRRGDGNAVEPPPVANHLEH
jgi:hypothetical protein